MANESQHSALFALVRVETLDALFDELRTLHRAIEERPRYASPKDVQIIRGIDPFRLYSVSFIAERLSLSANAVRDIDPVSLPRAPWRGQYIRYRGIDILRYEGVPEAELPGTIVRLNAAMTPEAMPRRKTPRQTGEKRIRSNNLPPL